MRVVLASSSPYRQQLLRQIHLPFTAVRPEVDEKPLQAQNLPVVTVAQELARLKGEAVAAKCKDDLVIAADQIAHFNGNILTKPETAYRAVCQLTELSGEQHELITAMWVRHPKKGIKTHVDRTQIYLHPLSADEIEAYVQLDQPLDCAGSYKIEQAGLALIKKLETVDHTAIVGLPLLALVQILKDWEMPMPFCWAKGTHE
jgi:septum formation protein